MIDVKYNETETGMKERLVIGDTIQELLDYCTPRVRNKSREFYTENVKKYLKQQGHTLIDHHAGLGTTYVVVLRDTPCSKLPKYVIELQNAVI